MNAENTQNTDIGASISRLSEGDFAKLFQHVLKKIEHDPIENFVKAKGLCKFIPTSPQEVILRVVCGSPLDGIRKKPIRVEASRMLDKRNKLFMLKNTRMTDREIYKYMTGKVWRYGRNHRKKINHIDLICGRRAGKTTLSALISLLFAIKTNWSDYLQTTPFATVLILSHTREFSTEFLDIIKKFVNDSPILKRLLSKNRKQTASAMNLDVPFIVKGRIVYSRVQIKVATASSKSTRGVAACAILCDEIAFWNLDETMVETDDKIVKALRPAMLQFGKKAIFLKLSSPSTQQGVLYKEYISFGKDQLPPSYAVFKVPTWSMNSIIPDEEIIEDYKYDPDGFEVEYGANFQDAIAGFLSPHCIDTCITSGIDFVGPRTETGIKYFATIDSGFKKDLYTFSIVSYDGSGQMVQHVAKGWKGTRKKPVKIEDTARYIQQCLKQYPVAKVKADQYAYPGIKEMYDKYDITTEETPHTATFRRKIYQTLKVAINNMKVKLLDHKIQTKELKELIAEKTSASGRSAEKVYHPKHGSDDFTDALANCVFQAMGAFGITKNDFEMAGAEDLHNAKSKFIPDIHNLVAAGILPADAVDNSSQYVVDKATGKLKRASEVDDDDDGGFTFTF